MSAPVQVGIVGLGRWAKVLTRAAAKSDKLRIVAGYSRSEEKRAAFAKDSGIAVVPEYAAMLSNPEIKGVILTVPNEQHWPVAEAAAKAGKHVYTEKPIANTLEDGLKRMYDRMPVPEVNFFQIVLTIQQKTGGNLSEALGNLSGVLRDRKRLQGKIAALSSDGLLSFT